MCTTGLHSITCPFLTDEIPGTGGVFKESCADFVVTEIPLYRPCGSGEHTYGLVEKTGITTLEMVRRLAVALAVPEREIGYAGMKDARGICRQTVSVPRTDPGRLMALDIAGVRFLSAERHNNKLRLGHLAGNRFSIRLRNVPDDAAASADRALAFLAARGVPNLFGSQRYGSQGNNASIGLSLLKGDHEGAVRALMGDPEALTDSRWRDAVSAFHAGRVEESLALFPGYCRTERAVAGALLRSPGNWDKGVKCIHPKLIALYLSACQSELFDRVVAARMPELDRVLPGDIAFKHVNGACFKVEDAVAENSRAATFELSPTGPMFGRKMLVPEGVPGDIEARVLDDAGVMPAFFSPQGGYRLEGERRPLRVPLGEPSAAMEGDALLVEFTLPKGSYATSVLREIMKTARTPS